MLKWIFIFVFFFSVAASGRGLFVWEKQLKGKVSMLSEETVTCPKLIHYACILRGEDPYVRAVPVYDAFGNMVECSYFDKKDMLAYHTYRRYDSKNHLLEVVERDPSGTQISRSEYRYTEAGLPAEWQRFDKRDSLSFVKKWDMNYFERKEVLWFDTSGLQTKEDNYNQDSTFTTRNYPVYPAQQTDDNQPLHDLMRMVFARDGSVRGWNQFLYNDRCDLVNTYFTSDSGGHTFQTSHKEYDTSGHILVSWSWLADGTPSAKQVYVYDSSGVKRSFSVYAWKDGYIPKTITRYNKYSQVTDAEYYDEKGRFSGKTLTLYNNKGLVCKTIVFDKDSAITNITYSTYEDIDGHGNWHKQTTWHEKDDEYPKIVITKRDFEYYQ